MKKVLVTNAVMNWAGFATQVVVTFFLAPLMVHRIGDQRYGIWSLVDSALAYMALFDMGLAASIVRYVSKYDAIGERENLNRVFNTTLAIFTVAGALVFLITLGLALSWTRPLGVPLNLAEETRWLLMLLGGKLAIELPMSVFGATLYGLNRYAMRTAINIGFQLLRAVLIVAVLWNGNSLVLVVTITVAVTIAEDLILALLVLHYLPGLRVSPRAADWATFRLIRGYSFNAFLAMIAGRISFQTDAMVIGAFLAPQYITFFAVGARLVEYGKSSLRTITSVLTPAVSRLESLDDVLAIRRVLIDATRYICYLVAPLQVGFLILGRDFINLWMGPRYADRSFPTLAILSLPLILVGCQSVCSRILYGLGLIRWFARAALSQALVNLFLSVILIRPLGIEGVAWGTTIPYIIFSLAMAAHTCSVIGQGYGSFLTHGLMKPLAAAGYLTLAWSVAVRVFGIPSWAAFVALGAAGVATYAILVILMEFDLSAVSTLTRTLGRRVAGRIAPARPEQTRTSAS